MDELEQEEKLLQDFLETNQYQDEAGEEFTDIDIDEEDDDE